MGRSRKDILNKAKQTAKRKYTRRTKKSKLLVGKNGRKYKNNIQELIDSISENDTYSFTEKLALKDMIDIYVNESHQLKTKMSINGFFGRLEMNRTDRLFRNLGYSTAEMADALGTSEDELREQSKWIEDSNGKYLELPDGRRFEFEFTYTGSVFKEVNIG